MGATERRALARLGPAALVIVAVAAPWGCVEEPPAWDKSFDTASFAARCEEPTAKLRENEQGMLPGRRCMVCHATENAVPLARVLDPLDEDDDERRDGGGGEGDGDDGPFSAAGTVYLDDSLASCNAGGAEDTIIRLRAPDGAVRDEVRSTDNGNFYFTRPIAFPVLVELERAGRVTRMAAPITFGDCAACHDGANHRRVAVPR